MTAKTPTNPSPLAPHAPHPLSCTLLQTCPLFSGMDEGQLALLLSSIPNSFREYPRGSFIFSEEEVPGKIFILIEGKVEVSKDTLTGRRILITSIQNPGEIFGEVYPFLRLPSYGIYARAVENTRILELFENLFLEQSPLDPDLFRSLSGNFLRILAQKAYFLNQKVRILGSFSLREKIARCLIQWQKPDGSILIPITREEMADYLNASRSALSRELGNMQREGILEIKKRQVVIKKQELLENYL